MLATQAAEWLLSRAPEMSLRQGLSAGKSGQPAMLAPPPECPVPIGRALGGGMCGRPRLVGSAAAGRLLAVGVGAWTASSDATDVLAPEPQAARALSRTPAPAARQELRIRTSCRSTVPK